MDWDVITGRWTVSLDRQRTGARTTVVEVGRREVSPLDSDRTTTLAKRGSDRPARTTAPVDRIGQFENRSRRAQTEPIAALVAVVAVVVAIGLYTAALAGLLPGTSDRTVEETTIDRVWADLEDDERGVFPVAEYESNGDEAMRDAISLESLPDGKNSYVEIRAYESGEPTVFAATHFDSDGDSVRDRQIDSTHADFGPPRGTGGPDERGVATRPISVAVTDADVRGGTLYVEVW
ncbi:hypothetical protein RBH26_03545 [Natronolimnohabitans sp. A-GB9]|uniref:DUF7285 family protein n=1 Tax=Natronolimnohabitans sp. A-GB9 TaxID=3069757 RepID=UPI0027B19A07|nr:hypothetical protein [Natronolimnohabitans sp. A-GB9]MDQ2049549.1 hypothetical protein [Natronolimnohabitans sp. A-GB9]